MFRTDEEDADELKMTCPDSDQPAGECKHVGRARTTGSNIFRYLDRQPRTASHTKPATSDKPPMGVASARLRGPPSAMP